MSGWSSCGWWRRSPPTAMSSGRRRAVALRSGRSGLVLHAGRVDRAVAVRVLGRSEVLLVVVLGVPVVAEWRDLSRDLAVPLRGHRVLVLLAGRLGRRLLLRRRRVDERSVLRAHVVALAHPLRRVVALPEDLEQVLERHLEI